MVLKKRKVSRWWRLAIIAALLVIILGYIGFTHIAPYAMLQPQRVSIDKTPAHFNTQFEDVTIQVSDSIDLKGYLVHAEQRSPKGFIILVHGIGGCKEHFLSLSSKLSREGISSLLVDGRAHGKSGGTYISYGFYEKMDVSKMVDFLRSVNSNIPIGIWGNSLGGAIAIQALEYDDRISFGVIESTFTELDLIVYDYKKRFLKGFGIKFLSDYALKEAGKIAQFNPDEVSPINSVKNIHQPVFIAHGDADQRIKFEYGKLLHEHLKSKHKVFERVEGAGHLNLMQTGGKEYLEKVLRFINAQLPLDSSMPLDSNGV